MKPCIALSKNCPLVGYFLEVSKSLLYLLALWLTTLSAELACASHESVYITWEITITGGYSLVQNEASGG